jgi:hypothetical protein
MGEETGQLVGTPRLSLGSFRLWKLETVGGITGEGAIPYSIGQRFVKDTGSVADTLRRIARRRQVTIEPFDGAGSEIFQLVPTQMLDYAFSSL